MRNNFGIFFVSIIIFFLSGMVQAAVITSAGTGYWNDTGTWIGNVIPSSTDSVVISSGHAIFFDRSDFSTTCGTIEIKSGGTLKFDSGTKTMQVKGNINVYGKLELVPGSTLKIECETNGQYGIIIQSGGELKGTGSVPTVLTTLTAPLAIGGQTITVVNASGFGVGDIITLGDGANAEGFTISALSGNQITLNRKALNAQNNGAGVYKNATVATSNISPGSKTFTVADLGGIKAGDRIAMATTSNYNQTEFRAVESVSSNSITVTQSFSYSHNSGAIVVKANRDALMTSHNAGMSYYIVVNENGKTNLDYIEIAHVRSAAAGEIYGFTLKSAIIGNHITGCSLHDGNFGILLFAGAAGINIVSNIAFNNNSGIESRWSSGKNTFISNICFSNNIGGINFDGDSSNNIVSYNILFSNSYGLFRINSDCLNLYMRNSLFSNNNYNIAFWNSDNGIVAYNDISDSQIGIDLDGSKYTFLLNEVDHCLKGFYVRGWKSNVLVENIFESNVEDLYVNPYHYNNIDLVLLANTFNSYEFNARGYILEQNTNHLPGNSKIYGEYFPAKGPIKRFNYAERSYPSSAGAPILFSGSNHTITTPEINDLATATEVWFATYRAASNDWEVKGTVSGLQSNRANSGVLYASDNSQVKFKITPNNPQEGDQFAFATIAAAKDANIQKKVFFGPSAIAELNNQSRLVVDPGGKIELKGTAEYPTLIDCDGAGSYGFIISGEVDAQYFDFNQINSDGVKIDPTATITRFDNGSIRNVSGLGPHLSVNGKDHAFNYLNFDNTGAYDVKGLNDADLVFVKSQRGTFSDSISDTASVSWDGPVPGYASDYVLGTCTVNPNTGVVAVPFKIKDPNSLNCTFKSGSAQYKVGDNYWRSIPDISLSGIDGTFGSAAAWNSAPLNYIYWSSKDQLGSTFEGISVEFRFRVNNGYVYENYGSSEKFIADFVPPAVAVISPNGGEYWIGGSTHNITWTAADNCSGVKDNSISIYYSTGEGYNLIAANEPNDGVYSWTMPVLDSTTVKIKITAVDKAGGEGKDESDAVFTIDSSPPTVGVVSPNGSESWMGGSMHAITWTAGDNFGLKNNPVSIYYSTGEGYVQIASNELNDGVYSWTLPALDSAAVRIKITAEDKAGNIKSDESDAVFTIDSSPPTVGVVSPNGDESWMGGSMRQITWIVTDGASGVKSNSISIYYSTGGEYMLIANNEPNAGTYNWTLPQIDSSTVKIKIAAQDNMEKTGSDESNAAFTIDSSAPSVNVISPNGKETLAGGLTHEVTWTASDNFGLKNNPVSIYYSTGEGYIPIAANEPNDGAYAWAVPKVDSNTARVKIIAADKAGNDSFDESDSVFKISVPPSVTLLSPNGAEKMAGNSTYKITWLATDEGGGFGLNPITIMYSTNGTDWDLIAANRENSSSYLWKVPDVNSSSVRIKVEAADQKGNAGSDASDSVFMIDSRLPILTLSSPNGGELFRGGTITTLTWSATDDGSGIADNSIALCYNAGAGDILIADNLANAGSYDWTVPKIDSKQVKVKITTRDNADQSGEDWSDDAFEIDSTPPATPSVNSAISPTPLATQLLSGMKSADSKYIYINGSRKAVNYSNDNNWSCLVNLIEKKNTFEVYAQDAAGNNSAGITVAIETGDVVFNDSSSPAQVKFPIGSVTKEVISVGFYRIIPPLGPMRGAVVAGEPVEIAALANDYSPIDHIQNPIEVILPVPSGASDPRVYFWNTGQKKWECLLAEKKDDKFKLNAAKLGIFAVFDVIDKKGPTISNFKVNGRRVAVNDSIPDQPEISVDISDDYGIDVGVLALSVDNQAVRPLRADGVQAQSEAAVYGTFKYLEKGPFSVGPHTFMITASDEVGNSSSFSETLYVVGAAVSGLMVYPNPYTLGGTLKFDGLSGDVNVYIYDAAADLVWKGFTSGAASISWDGKNHAGNTVAPGVYFYAVKDAQGNKSTGKIAVIK